MSIAVQKTRTSAHIVINRPVEEVFAYVTTPENWRAHPFNSGLRGEVARPRVLGDRWVELVRSIRDPETSDEISWHVTELIPGALWAMQTRNLRGYPGVLSEFLYEFEAVDGGTRFTRSWTSYVEGTDEDSRALIRHLDNGEPGERYLERLKLAIEAAA